MIQSTETLGEIATAHPASTRILLRHRLDFCCGGGQKLADACRAAGLDPDSVIAEIAVEEASTVPERWDSKPFHELVDFIIVRYHETLRSDLPALIEAARKVERVHAKKDSCPHGLAALLAQLDTELGHHMAKEEQMLFPALRRGNRGAHVHMPIRVMMQEHDDHSAALAQLRKLATDFDPPGEACATWRALYAGLQKLESELMEHIHLENNVLFKRALNA